MNKNEYDLMKIFEDSKLVPYRNLLTSIKAFNFQKDFYNCIPYCLFVNAMLYGLESGDTDFKIKGINQFWQDFGVRIIKREEILPPSVEKPQVKILE